MVTSDLHIQQTLTIGQRIQSPLEMMPANGREGEHPPRHLASPKSSTPSHLPHVTVPLTPGVLVHFSVERDHRPGNRGSSEERSRAHRRVEVDRCIHEKRAVSEVRLWVRLDLHFSGPELACPLEIEKQKDRRAF